MGRDPVLVAPAALSDTASRGPLRVAGRWVATAALVVAVIVAVGTLGAALLGYQRYVITGASMTGTFDRGSLLFSETVPVPELRVGDVITYTPPERTGTEGLVTHRIIWIGDDRQGREVFRTKGDANPVRDPWRFTLPGPEQARASFGVPYVGYGFAALDIPQVRMLLIGVPALLVALALLVRLWRQAGEEARELNRIARAKVEASGSAEGS